MTKEEWKAINQKLKDAASYTDDAAKRIRWRPDRARALVALMRINGARAALDMAEDRLNDYVEGMSSG